ncbi:MAG: hypothetical protein MJK10_21125 [Pseudomonadales bacterium]|nr:hypothetical protein [Pseudomonadales bacterium]NRA18502.1 pyroglutamyl-peptidase I [Oceanospirillaceae bacterium]
MQKILITGFEKFAGASSNPTEEMLSDFFYSGAKVKTQILPVTFCSAFSELQAVIEQFDPDFILLCGLAENRDKISIEKIGINYINSRIADNAGEQPLDVKISPGGDDGHFSTFPSTALVSYLQQHNIELMLSLSAGSYLCNFVLYKTLEMLHGSSVKTTFVHFPKVGPGTSIKLYRLFLQHTLDYIVQQPSLSERQVQTAAKSFAITD